jgi:hypothetical protein
VPKRSKFRESPPTLIRWPQTEITFAASYRQAVAGTSRRAPSQGKNLLHFVSLIGKTVGTGNLGIEPQTVGIFIGDQPTDPCALLQFETVESPHGQQAILPDSDMPGVKIGRQLGPALLHGSTNGANLRRADIDILLRIGAARPEQLLQETAGTHRRLLRRGTARTCPPGDTIHFVYNPVRRLPYILRGKIDIDRDTGHRHKHPEHRQQKRFSHFSSSLLIITAPAPSVRAA